MTIIQPDKRKKCEMEFCNNKQTDIAWDNCKYIEGPDGLSYAKILRVCKDCAGRLTDSGEYLEVCPNCGCWMRIN